MGRRLVALLAWLAVAATAALATGCADVKAQGDGGGPDAADGPGSPFGDAGSSNNPDALGVPPVDFTPGDSDAGGYKRGIPIANDLTMGPGSGPKICNTITGVVRDFKGALAATGGELESGGHPDFEVYEGRLVTSGLVGPNLVKNKPVYTGRCQRGAPVSLICPNGAMTTSEERFHEWYHSTAGVNRPYLVYFQLAPGANGVSTFKSSRFFPMDGAGFGDNGIGLDDKPHNFGFTTEIHTTFRYMGGETFSFDGDDDLWVFINGKLAVDLGGLHEKEQGRGSVNLDAEANSLAITKGGLYPLDLFHAERHSVESNFHIDLNFTFEDCGYVVP